MNHSGPVPEFDTETILVAGTASHVGKSVVAAGLCRYLATEGYDVAPFKGQNMSNNARVALSPDGNWGEIGVSQYVQARAANVVPTTDMNPVLLKPRGDGESQLVIQGEAVEHVEAGAYYEKYWQQAREAVAESYERLAETHDVVVAEGAGSIAEINLHERDLANVETATIADASILLVADIERGGAFASIYGTIELMPSHLTAQVAGIVINKFRGDSSLLEPGIEEIEARTGVPVIGVLPYDDPGLPAEDSVSLPDEDTHAVVGEDEAPAAQTVTIAVPRLPHISNFTDLEPLANEPGVRVRYVPLESKPEEADAVVLPGTKNTVDDLLALNESGMAEQLRQFEGPIVGLCGGYQLLGERITNAGIESTRDVETVEGLSILPVETAFSENKRVTAVTRTLDGAGPLAGGSGPVTGYEIHMGRTKPTADVTRPLGEESAATDQALGTYLHGLFENENARDAFLDTVFATAGVTRPDAETSEQRDSALSPYDRACRLVSEHLDLSVFDRQLTEPTTGDSLSE